MTRVIDAWERFWFAPEPTSTLGVFRIAVGLLVLGWTVSLAPDLFDFFSSQGIIPDPPRYGGDTTGLWSILGYFPSDSALLSMYAALLLASICLTVGLGTRVAAVVVFVGVMAFQRRDPFVFNGGDQLVRILAFYLMLAPAGAALSLDRRLLSRGSLWEFPLRAPWVLRLLQIQTSVIYLFAVWAKVRGTTWNDGSAVYYSLHLVELQRFPVPAFLTETAFLSNLLTYGTLAIEASIGILVWNRRLRPWVLGAGVLLHLGIDYSIRVGFFSYALIALYIVWIRPETMSAWLLALRGRLEGSRAGALRRLAGAPAPPESRAPAAGR